LSLITRMALLISMYFWVLWGLSLVVTVGVALYLDGRFRRAAATSAKSRTIVWPDAPTCLLLAAFFLAYVGFMLWDEQFAYHDNGNFIDYSVAGKPRGLLIWLSNGRFWPLGYQEYDLLGRLSPVATSYLTLGALELLVVLVLIFLALKDQPQWARVTTVVILMLAPAFAASYAELTYVERNVIFWFCALFFAIQRHELTQSRFWLVAGVVAAGFALYTKETAVPLLGSFIASRLLLKAFQDGAASALRLPIEVGSLIACLGYISALAIVLASSHIEAREMSYLARTSTGTFRAMAGYLTTDPLVAAFLIAFGIHLTASLRARRALDPFWDALAVGGVLNFAVVASTGIWEDYLLGPTELVAAVTLLRLWCRWWQGLKRPGRALLVATGALILMGSTGFGVFRLIERKNVVRETTALADFLVAHYQRPEALADRLYFPSSGNGYVLFFVTYLNYRGLPIAFSDEPTQGKIEVAGSGHFENDRCAGFANYVCRNDAPAVGDLIVRLPEDHKRMGLAIDGIRLDPLIEVLPFGMPSPKNPLSFFSRISPGLERNPMPENWLRAGIYRVKAETPD
jgi:hypothetical protein